jgi:demethylmenaquinone methyltransferase / 2-methoxy-6-polyprenyl-1,4-benzoquinol methylase
MVWNCCRCAGAVAVVPLAVILAVMLETPTVTKLDGTLSTKEGLSRAKSSDDSKLDATEASKAGGEAAPRMGSGSMFDRIAFVYDSTNKWMSLGLDQHWRRTLVQDCLQLQKDDKVLDLATGTADVSLLVGENLKELGASYSTDRPPVIGLDPSSEMLRRGVSKVENRKLKEYIRLVKGDAQDLSSVQSIDAEGTVASPSAGDSDSSVDKISMSFGIRNVPDRRSALMEMHRVLRKRPSSRVCILEFSLPTGQGVLASIARVFITRVVPFIGSIATMGSGSEEYDYLERSILRFPQPLDFAAELGRAGLPVQTITSFAFGAVNLYSASPST